MIPNKINFYSLEDLIKFILTKVALGLVNNVNCSIIGRNNNLLFRLSIDQCFVFSMPHIAVAAILEDRALTPLLIKVDDIEFVRHMIINILESVSEELNTNLFNSEVIIECIYNDAININFDVKTKQVTDLNKKKEEYCKLIERILNSRPIIDRYDEDDDEEEWYV